MILSSLRDAADRRGLPEAEGVAGDDQLGVLVPRREVAKVGDEFIGEVAEAQVAVAAEMEVADEIEHTGHGEDLGRAIQVVAEA